MVAENNSSHGTAILGVAVAVRIIKSMNSKAIHLAALAVLCGAVPSVAQVSDGGKPVNIDFTGDMAKRYGIEKDGHKYYCIGQRVGLDGTNPVPLSIYGGLPFPPRDNQGRWRNRSPHENHHRRLGKGVAVANGRKPGPGFSAIQSVYGRVKIPAVHSCGERDLAVREAGRDL